MAIVTLAGDTEEKRDRGNLSDKVSSTDTRHVAGHRDHPGSEKKRHIIEDTTIECII